MQRNDQQIDELRHKMFEDPKTGERQIIMIKDYVVHDIITTNHQAAGLPVFFAVTIPQENMARYFPNLQMEGMAYRLTRDRRTRTTCPMVDAQKVLENMLGVYRLGALLDGDTAGRQKTLSGHGRVWPATAAQQVLGQSGPRLCARRISIPCDGMLGKAAHGCLPQPQCHVTCWATIRRP